MVGPREEQYTVLPGTPSLPGRTAVLGIAGGREGGEDTLLRSGDRL